MLRAEARGKCVDRDGAHLYPFPSTASALLEELVMTGSDIQSSSCPESEQPLPGLGESTHTSLGGRSQL